MILLLSCANDAKSNDAYLMDTEKIDAFEYTKYNTLTDYESIASLKLEEYFDLLKLEKEHPSFKDDILLQINEYSNDSLLNYDISKIKSIQNIRQVGNTEQFSDSIKKIQLRFNLIMENKVIQDSIIAVINSKSILLDGKKTTSNKITLSRKH